MFTTAIISTLAVTATAYRNELDYSFPAGEEIRTPQPHTYIKASDLPVSLDYREKGLLTGDLNQHIPVYCGSCWAHSAFSSIGDRLKIQSKGIDRDVIPSVQALINCGHAGSCNGGNSGAANRYVFNNGIPDVTCQQYQAINMECSDINYCMNCDHDPEIGCSAVKNYPIIRVSEFGVAHGEDQIMAEIFARGPVSAAINAECIETYSGGINMYDTCKTSNLHNNHAIQLNGWGTEDGTDYWIGRNSWGTYWGEKGFFRIVRGGNYKPNSAQWAVPYLDVTGTNSTH